MDLGVNLFLTDISISPAKLARELEDRGFSALYMAEHTHIPVSRTTPYPMGGEMPENYKRTLDPFVALATAAAVTERLKLGTGICLVTEHDPIALAKSVASLDHVSGGRFTFGIGVGWNREEAASHGVVWEQRRALAADRIHLMKALWTQEEASFEGEHARLSPSWAWPKPVQKPHPRILVGAAAGPITFAGIADYADGWMPIGGKGIREDLPKLQAAFEAAGRDPATIEVVPCGVWGEAGKLAYLAELGVKEAMLQLPLGDEREVMDVLDRYTPLLGAT